MKIGVALSGCDMGGLSAFSVLRLLEEKGFSIEMVSCCSIPAVTALLYGTGEPERASRVAADFLAKVQAENLDNAIAAASEQLSPALLRENGKIAVSAVNVEDGKVLTYTNAFSLNSERLRTLPLVDSYDILSATISPLDGLSGYRMGSLRLCDYAVWYGCPLYPLKMQGISRTISIAFLPESPKTPYEVMTGKNGEETAATAEIHIPIRFPPALPSVEEYATFAAVEIERHMDEIAWKLLDF